MGKLNNHKRFVNKNKWVVLGDFNVSLNMEDSFVGSSMNMAMNE